MSISQITYLLPFLEQHSCSPLKRFSQNFLVDGNIVSKILSVAEVKEGDLCIEIGPGPGALTEGLLAKGASVCAIEIDRSFAQALRRLSPDLARLQILETDALEIDWEKLLSSFHEQGFTKSQIKIISNLPYHITTPLLVKILPLHLYAESATLMMQKEVGVRLKTSHPSASSGYDSSLALYAGFFSRLTSCFTVSSSCFYPKPTVESIVMRFALTPPPADVPIPEFFQMTRTAFGKKRKLLTSSLRQLYSKERVEKALFEIGLSVTARPAELPLGLWVDLFRACHEWKEQGGDEPKKCG